MKRFLLILCFFASLNIYANPNTQSSIITENIRGIRLQFFNDGSAFLSSNPQRIATLKKIIHTAEALTGTPYRAGGNSPETGFDCSGFVRYVFDEAANIRLPASARNIANVGFDIKKEALAPGDLIFFNTLKLPFTHVAIYLGNQAFIHAPSAGSVVRLDSLESAYWSQHFNGAKRIALD